MNRFQDKICLVTGASRGIGLATAKRLFEECATVIICSSKEENIKKALELLPQSPQIHGFACDIASRESRHQLSEFIAKQFGRLDVLILNQGIISHIGNQMDITEEQFDETINVNLKGTFFMIKECLPLLKKGVSANILMTSSMSSIDPFHKIGVYGITKAGINNMVKSLSKEFMDLNIRVNAIAPGFVDTEMAGPFLEGVDKNKKGIGKPEEIASVIATICCKDGSFMNGETYFVNGGCPQI